MRLLLDEHFTPALAIQLRRRGHDVSAVVEQRELVALPDDEISERAIAQRRAVVTNNVPDYVAYFQRLHAAGREHFGLLLTDDRSMPRDKRLLGRFVRALDAFLRAHPAEDALRNQLHWLRPD